jgi:hypothetical protein
MGHGEPAGGRRFEGHMQAEGRAADQGVKLKPKHHQGCSGRPRGGILTDHSSILILICDSCVGGIAGHDCGVDEQARRNFSFEV